MKTRIETVRDNAGAVMRSSWLAYLGLYGAAYERAKPRVETLAERANALFGDLVAKGDTIENTAQERLEDARERAQGVYSVGVKRVKGAMPSGIAANDRVKELEAEVEALNKKIEALAKKPARKTTKAKTKAKAA